MTAINLKINTNSETSSSYNDSCYGSSEMDVHHHHPQPQKSTGKLLVSSNEKYIVLCKDQETSSASSSPSSSSTGNNVSLITKYQTNKRIQTTQLKSSDANLEYFPINHEYKKIPGTSTTFNYRHITPLNEYYL